MYKKTMENGKKSVAIYNLGCKVNHYEAEMMEQRFRENGYDIVPFSEKADIYIINTCSVTQIADKKSRQFLARAHRNNPGATVVAAGCAADAGKLTRDGEILCDLVVSNAEKRDIVRLVEEYLASGQDSFGMQPGQSADADENDTRESDPADKASRRQAVCFHEGQLRETANIRAFIKVQDGCDQFCSYCIIPYARGRSISRDEEEILREINGLAARGIREVVLTGIHLSSYHPASAGGDPGGKPKAADDATPFGTALLTLVERVCNIPGIVRVRLGSLEPRLITPETAKFFGRLAREGKLCPHFHLSLQSGCDETLRRMNRHYTAEQYARGVALLRSAIDRPAITTDVITGFPGETDEEFAQTKRFLEQLELYEIHVFPYSRRTGTVAAGMPDQVRRAEKERRSAELLGLTAAQARNYRSSFLGEELTILTEEEVTLGEEPYLIGHTERYLRAAVPAAAGIRPGQCVTGKAARFLTDDVIYITPAIAKPDIIS